MGEELAQTYLQDQNGAWLVFVSPSIFLPSSQMGLLMYPFIKTLILDQDAALYIKVPLPSGISENVWSLRQTKLSIGASHCQPLGYQKLVVSSHSKQAT